VSDALPDAVLSTSDAAAAGLAELKPVPVQRFGGSDSAAAPIEGAAVAAPAEPQENWRGTALAVVALIDRNVIRKRTPTKPLTDEEKALLAEDAEPLCAKYAPLLLGKYAAEFKFTLTFMMILSDHPAEPRKQKEEEKPDARGADHVGDRGDGQRQEHAATPRPPGPEDRQHDRLGRGGELLGGQGNPWAPTQRPAEPVRDFVETSG
jgi:hypothetical protein